MVSADVRRNLFIVELIIVVGQERSYKLSLGKFFEWWLVKLWTKSLGVEFAGPALIAFRSSVRWIGSSELSNQ